MTYDAREYLKALTPPTFIAPDGHEYRGRILSHHERAQLHDTMAALAAQERPNLGDTEAAFRGVLGLLFPDPAAVDAILELPPEGVQEALLDFLASQRRPQPPGPALVVETVASPAPPAATAGG